MTIARASALLVALAFATAARSAWARHGTADERHACVTAASKGQDLRDAGKLVEAREEFVSCARDVCPGVVSTHCATWLRDVDRDMPTVTFRAKDAGGQDVADVRVFVDDAPRLESLDGRAVAIDPGQHRFRYVRGDAEVDDTLVIRSGEKDRLVDIVFPGPKGAPAASSGPASGTTASEAPAPAPAASSGFRFPLLAGIAAGVGVASFGAMAGLALSASSDADHLRTTCAPYCTSGGVDTISTKILLANVALGVGAASIGVLAVTLVVANVGGDHESADAPRTGRLELRVQPRVGGASAGVFGTW